MRDPFGAATQRAAEHRLDCSVNLWSSPAGGARVGGDWCEAIQLSDDAIALTVGDVAGHGEPAAEAKEAVRNAIFAGIHESADPAMVLAGANSVAYAWGEEGVMVTAIVAILNRRLRTLVFANAGHPPPLVMTAEGHGFVSHVVGDLPLGIFRAHRASDYVVAVPAGALIVFYTDGITEHARDIFLGEDELVEACRSLYDLPVADTTTQRSSPCARSRARIWKTISKTVDGTISSVLSCA
jgi:serine phosphatase RsbU (regulator of sigma subunit)